MAFCRLVSLPYDASPTHADADVNTWNSGFEQQYEPRSQVPVAMLLVHKSVDSLLRGNFLLGDELKESFGRTHRVAFRPAPNVDAVRLRIRMVTTAARARALSWLIGGWYGHFLGGTDDRRAEGT